MLVKSYHLQLKKTTAWSNIKGGKEVKIAVVVWSQWASLGWKKKGLKQLPAEGSLGLKCAVWKAQDMF